MSPAPPVWWAPKSSTGCARAPDAEVTAWNIGSEPPPPALSGHWDVIVHTAASTRWTMSRAEAVAANVDPLRAVLALADADTHVVHVSTAYVAGARAQEDLRDRSSRGTATATSGRRRPASRWCGRSTRDR
ncbi:SDR family oxidoreductase [Streptomyces sp. NBC_01518]|uniref:SDR family oxidoreductase n=1 Tax=Streptomyces sp. NBC_01518 TaxID=2903891 RepID=UPI00386CBDE3